MSKQLKQPTLGAVLAGGRSSRLGQPKQCIEFRGQSLINYPLEALVSAGLETVVVAKTSTPLPKMAAAHTVVIEPTNPTHPLMGVLRALEHSNGRPIIALGCDMPFVPSALLVELANGTGSVVVPKVGGFLQPLCALYRPDVADSLRKAIDDGCSAITTLLSLDPEILPEKDLAIFGDPELMFTDIDTEEDLRLLQ